MGHGGYLKRFPDWFVNGQTRPSAGRYTFATWNYFNRDSKPVSSGLLGPVRVMVNDWKQDQSAMAGMLMVESLADSAAMDAFEADVPKKESLLPIAAMQDGGKTGAEGGAKDADALRNGTTRNGSGAPETADDGKTFRGYGKGNSLLIQLDLSDHPEGHVLDEIRSFAGHGDARASQAYSVWIAKADAPDRFVRVGDAYANISSGASQVRVPIRAKGVAAIRIDFANGPAGFNVYREISLIGGNDRR